MNVGQICQHPVITVRATDELRTAAKLMREHHIGFLVVVAPESADAGLVGVITDRDIVISTLALDIDPRSVNVGDVMTRSPAFTLAEDTVADALCEMRHRGVRRLPVMGGAGKLMGVVSLDDILRQHGDEIGAAAAVLSKGRRREEQLRD